MRARNIKPGFFSNEDLAEMPAEGRLLFIGLWSLADREGKLEDRPKRIKGELFRFDDIPVGRLDSLLEQLSSLGLIIRYEVNGFKYIKIPKFLKHQRPHVNEKPSIIPEPIVVAKVASTSYQGSKSEQPGDEPLRSDSLNNKLGILNPDLEDIAPPGPRDASCASKIFTGFFACRYFEVDLDYRLKLAKEFPAVDDDRLRKELSNMEDWITDNPKKKKFKANGHLANPKLFIKNWLDRVDGIPGPGSDKPKGFAAIQRFMERGEGNG